MAKLDINSLLDIEHPELHCLEKHNHDDSTFDKWEDLLTWANRNCGYNEGAGWVIKLAVKEGLSYPELMQGCPDAERYIPLVEEAKRNPDSLDRFSSRISPGELAALKKMLREEKPFPEILAEAPREAVGVVWSRKAMMRFASTLAKRHSCAAAAAIAIASQWHNCHGFKCLLRHPDEICDWLRNS
jgi:hypothetical protein